MNYFFQFCVLSLDTPNFKIFMIKFVLFFLLLPLPLVSYSRNHCQIQCCEAFAWCSSTSFIVSVLTFKSQIRFQFIFGCGIRVQFSQDHLLKRLSFPHRTDVAPLSKVIWLRTQDVFLGALFSSWSVSLYASSTPFGYCRF